MRMRLRQWLSQRGRGGMGGQGPDGGPGRPGGPGVAGGGDWNRPMPDPGGAMQQRPPVNPALARFGNQADYEANLAAWNAAGGDSQAPGASRGGAWGGQPRGGLPAGPGQQPVPQTGFNGWGMGGNGLGMQGILSRFGGA